MATCEFNVVRTRDHKKGYGNVYLMYTSAQPIPPQVITSGGIIPFNKFESMINIKVVSSGVVQVLKKGTYEISFIINYVNAASLIRIGLLVNSVQVGGTHFVSTTLSSGNSQIIGSYTLRFNQDDLISLVGLNGSFTIGPSGVGSFDERLASLTIREI